MKNTSLTLNNNVFNGSAIALNQESTSFPTSKNEDYKHFPLHLLKDTEWNLSEKSEIPWEKVQKYIEPHHNPDWDLLVFYNGFLIENEVPLHLKPFLVTQHAPLMESIFHPHLLKHDYFKNLNFAFSPQKSILTITQTLEKPIHIVFLTLNEKSLSLPTLFINLDENIEASIFTSYISGCKRPAEPTLLSPYVHVNLLAGSTLTYNHLTHSKPLVQNLTFMDVMQGAHSTLNYNATNTCGGLSLTSIHAYLLFKDATCNLNGAYYTKENQHIEWIAKVYHLAGETYSNQLFKGITPHKSSFSFFGDIVVDKNATGVEAHQLSKNVMLHPNSKIYTRPTLHIQHNDLICSHGATIGGLNEEEIYYLKTRGVPQKEATKLIMLSFIYGLFNLIEDDNWRENVLIHLHDMMD